MLPKSASGDPPRIKMRIRTVDAALHAFRPMVPAIAALTLAGGWMSVPEAPPSLDASDEWTALLTAIATRRDRQAFERLFGFFAPRIKSYMLRGGMAPAVAEDIAQEALLSVWRKAGLFDPARASAATWIFTIARKLRIDARRRDGRWRAVVDGGMPLPEPQSAPLADEIALDAERGAMVRAALADLSHDQARIIHLSFFEDKPHAEIARELAIPLGTVKSRVRLAAARLRKLLEDRP